MTEADLPAGSAAEGVCRLSALDAAFLFFERPNQPLHIGCIAELEASISLEELLEALTARLLPIRRFRQRPVRSPLDLRWPTILSLVKQPATGVLFNGRLGYSRRMAWRLFPLDEFVSLRAAADCTTNDAVLAVIADALRRYLDEEHMCLNDLCLRGARAGERSQGEAWL